MQWISTWVSEMSRSKLLFMLWMVMIVLCERTNLSRHVVYGSLFLYNPHSTWLHVSRFVLTSCEVALFLLRWIRKFTQTLFHQCVSLDWFWFVHLDKRQRDSCRFDLFALKHVHMIFRIKTWIQVCDFQKDEVDSFTGWALNTPERTFRGCQPMIKPTN